MDGETLIQKLSDHLGDQEPGYEYTTWSCALLAWDLYIAIFAAISAEPENFSAPKDVTLERDETIHNFCEECAKFGGIISIEGVGCSGDIEIISGRHADAMGAYNLVWDCDKLTDDDEWTPGNISFLESSPCTICFENPTPSDRDITITIACVEKPTIDTSGNKCELTVPDAVFGPSFPIVWKYALHLVYDAENESIVSTAKSKQHHQDIILWVKNIFPIKEDFLADTNLTELSDDD